MNVKQEYQTPSIEAAEEMNLIHLLESLSLGGNVDEIEEGDVLNSTTNF